MTLAVTVVVCAHRLDRLADLRRSILSVLNQSSPPGELLVVVDHNPGLLHEAVRLAGSLTTAAGPSITVVANRGPRGLSGARNTGTERAVGDVVVYLDDDAAASVDWLANLTAPFREPDVVAVGGRALPEWEEARPRWFPREFDWVVGCSHRGLPDRRSEVRNVIGCTMSFRRRAVLDAGGFETLLGRTANRVSGCEETELCIRLRQRDPAAKIIYEPTATIEHRVPAGRGTWRYFLRRCAAEGASKATVARLVGSSAGLSSERAYVATVLPRAVGRAVTALPRAPIANLGNILAIGGGLIATGGGYLGDSIRHRV